MIDGCYRATSMPSFTGRPKLISAALAAAAITAGLLPAAANWQFTRWNMTTAELAAMSPNIAATTPAERKDHSNSYVGEALLKSGYAAQELQYTAYFVFKEDRLVAVHLRGVDANHGPTARMRLEQVYGAPIADKSRRMAGGTTFCLVTDKQWRSEREGYEITFTGMDCNYDTGNNFYSIKYRPILTTGRTGL